MELGLRGRKAIVCASSQGFGFACASALAREGVHVFINGRDAKRLESARENLVNTRAQVTAVTGDLATPEGRAALVSACPSPDILITNMGSAKVGDFRNFDETDWSDALNRFVTAPIMLMQAVIDGMIERRFGRILNLTSRAVKAPAPLNGLSNGSRAGLSAFMLGVAREVAHHNVTINNLLPGPFQTERQETLIRTLAHRSGVDAEVIRRERLAEVPAGRFGELEELASYCAFLCSVHAGFIVGQNLLIDGGAVPTG